MANADSAQNRDLAEFFVSEDVSHSTERDARRTLAEHNMEAADRWILVGDPADVETGPTVKAYHLLKNLDLGPALTSSTDQPCLGVL